MPGQKKNLDHLSQEMRRRYKRIYTKPVSSRVNNLQKGRFFVIKNHSISAEPDRPTQMKVIGCSSLRGGGGELGTNKI